MRTRRAAYSPPAPAPAPPPPLFPLLPPCQPLDPDAFPHPAKRARLGDDPSVICAPHQSCGAINQCDNDEGRPFDALPDDLVLSIMASLSSSASSPLDLVNATLTCRRFRRLASHPLVLGQVTVAALRVRASRWCEHAQLFLARCAHAGNAEACYVLGMIRFYCLHDRAGGLHMLTAAAAASLPGALHSLAIIQFNGSGGASREEKNLKAGVRLCARAAALHHIDAMRELGHCLQDGYGVPKNVLAGRRLILEANAREAARALAQCKLAAVAVMGKLPAASFLGTAPQCGAVTGAAPATPAGVCACTRVKGAEIEHAALHISHYLYHHPVYRILQSGGCSLLSDFGCNVPPPALQVAHEFLLEWFLIHPPPAGLRMCSYPKCGRPETRKHEFRRCSACASVNYCSRACQALDWKLRHKFICCASRPPLLPRHVLANHLAHPRS